ncbi:hypothetical protein Lal_00041694 [Lupinus albus]|nr:hypothetical protein Lal_00041694 [Lupinus albus]
MTRGNTGHLHPINPEIDRTYHRLVRQSRNLPFHSVPDSVSDSISNSIHVSVHSVQYTDFVHSVALSDSEHSENSVHSENMAQPPTPPGPRHIWHQGHFGHYKWMMCAKVKIGIWEPFLCVNAAKAERSRTTGKVFTMSDAETSDVDGSIRDRLELQTVSTFVPQCPVVVTLRFRSLSYSSCSRLGSYYLDLDELVHELALGYHGFVVCALGGRLSNLNGLDDQENLGNTAGFSLEREEPRPSESVSVSPRISSGSLD